MTEWIDFSIYALQALVFWVFLPRHGRQFGAPMIADRNPDWLAANPGIVAYFRDNTNFLKLWYAWATVSIGVLLAVRLGWRPFGPTATPSWDILKDTHTLFMMLGVVGWFASAAIWFRWLSRHVPLADTRSATLRPRTAESYISWSWRVVVETLTVLHLAAWFVVAALQDELPANYWRKFVFVVAMTVLFAVLARLVPRRRPGYPERIFGGAYRRMELRAAYVLRLAPIIGGATVLGETLTGGDFARAANLLLVLLVTGLLGVFLFLRPLASGAGGTAAPARPAGGPEMIGTRFGSSMRGSVQERRAV
jgi:hypothetical protein